MNSAYSHEITPDSSVQPLMSPEPKNLPGLLPQLRNSLSAPDLDQFPPFRGSWRLISTPHLILINAAITWIILEFLMETASVSAQGVVVAVHGAVIEACFAAGALPPINTMLSVAWDKPEQLILEVHSHKDECTVRAIALHDTAGLARGTRV